MLEFILQRKQLRREAFCAYILSRLQRVATDGDPAFPHLPELAQDMGVVLDIRQAQKDVHAAFSPDLAEAIELALTGAIWSEEGDRLTSN